MINHFHFALKRLEKKLTSFLEVAICTAFFSFTAISWSLISFSNFSNLPCNPSLFSDTGTTVLSFTTFSLPDSTRCSNLSSLSLILLLLISRSLKLGLLSIIKWWLWTLFDEFSSLEVICTFPELFVFSELPSSLRFWTFRTLFSLFHCFTRSSLSSCFTVSLLSSWFSSIKSWFTSGCEFESSSSSSVLPSGSYSSVCSPLIYKDSMPCTETHATSSGWD